MAVMPESYLELLPRLRAAHPGSFWLSYDEMGDVLYISFKRPNLAESTDPIDADHLDFLARYDANDEVIGYTILNASRHGYAG